MLREEMEDVAYGVASFVVDREQKDFYLTGDKGCGRWIYDICCAVLHVFAGYFLQTSIKGKVNSRLFFSGIYGYLSQRYDLV